MSWLQSWLEYDIVREIAKAIYGEDRSAREHKPPIHPQTEAEIRADERRYAEEERRLDAADRAAKSHAH
jgi:hypothetical protein